MSFAQEKTKNLQEMDAEQHGHVPYVLLLFHYLEEWKSKNGGKVPENYKEKAAFRDLVRQGTRTNNAEGGEENYEEAVAAVLKSLNPAVASSSAKEVLTAPECSKLTRQVCLKHLFHLRSLLIGFKSPDFWVIAHAINDFYVKHSVLPLSGSLPDMKAKSADYIQLQNIYKNKARQDVAEVYARVEELDEQLQRPTETPQKEVEAFCKSAAYVKLVRGRSPHLVRPSLSWEDRARYAANDLTNPDSLILLYIAFIASDRYVAAHGTTNGHTQSDSKIEQITTIAFDILKELLREADETIDEPEHTEVKQTLGKHIDELVRADGGELHNIAAATGGMVAQEVIKVITKQYVPVDNTCLFDGISSKSSVLKL